MAVAIRFRGVKVEEAPPEAVPVCPRCERELSTVWAKSKGLLTQHRLFMCSPCRVVLGFASLSV